MTFFCHLPLVAGPQRYQRGSTNLEVRVWPHVPQYLLQLRREVGKFLTTNPLGSKFLELSRGAGHNSWLTWLSLTWFISLSRIDMEMWFSQHLNDVNWDGGSK